MTESVAFVDRNNRFVARMSQKVSETSMYHLLIFRPTVEHKRYGIHYSIVEL